jgi:hypothetical protein
MRYPAKKCPGLVQALYNHWLIQHPDKGILRKIMRVMNAAQPTSQPLHKPSVMDVVKLMDFLMRGGAQGTVY